MRVEELIELLRNYIKSQGSKHLARIDVIRGLAILARKRDRRRMVRAPRKNLMRS